MIVLSHKTAFLFWRRFTGSRATLKPLRFHVVSQKAKHTEALPQDELAALGITPTAERPVDLLFFTLDSRIQRAYVRSHLTKDALPYGTLLQVSPEVAVVSPELCFAQLTKQASIPALARIGTELCGTFALVGGEGKIASREQLMTAESLRRLLTKLNPAGTGKVHEAAKYVLDNAASPMEGRVALLLTLPATKGGYGLPAPQLNTPIPLGPDARTLYPHNLCRADLFWSRAGLDVEYDGEEAHAGEMHGKDPARTAALKAEGVEVLAISAVQVYDSKGFAEVAKLIGARVGKPVRIRVKDFDARHAALREELGLA